MKTGKLDPATLRRLVLDRLGARRDDVLVHPRLGEDAAAVAFGDEVCVLSSDPITGAGANAGWYAVHVACNDVAAMGARPVGVLATLLFPETSVADDVARLMDDIHRAAVELGIEVLGALQPTDGRMADHLKAAVAAELLKQFQPAFMAVHFSITDTVQHANGPLTAAAFAAIEETDQNIGDLVAGIDAAGLSAFTTLIVTGDHGFLPMHTELAINLPLIEAGLITKGPDGHPSWSAVIAANRGLGSLYVKDKSPGVLAKARAALEKYAAMYPRRFRILERAELDEWSADREALLGVEPTVGYVLDARLAPPFQQPHQRAAGHGYRPDTPGMETGFIAYGAGVRAGWVLPVTNTIDVAPTIATLLGLELADADGKPIVGVLKDSRTKN